MLTILLEVNKLLKMKFEIISIELGYIFSFILIALNFIPITTSLGLKQLVKILKISRDTKY